MYQLTATEQTRIQALDERIAEIRAAEIAEEALWLDRATMCANCDRRRAEIARIQRIGQRILTRARERIK